VKWTALIVMLLPATSAAVEPVRIGSKQDTETTVLAQVLSQVVNQAGVPTDTTNKLRLGGTPVVWQALLAGSIDAYVEYTGTLTNELFAGRGLNTDDALRAELRRHGVGMTRSLGFANNYAIGMRRRQAEELGIKTISDLRNHPGLVFRFSNDFMKRNDGWPGLRRRYDLPQQDVRGMDHRLAYAALSSGTIAATELYTTDAEIRKFDLVALKDDRGFFPVYEAVIVYRLDLEQRAPAAVAAFESLAGKFDEATVIGMNGRAATGEPPQVIAADFVEQTFHERPHVEVESDAHRLWRLTGEHLTLVGISLGAAILVALPLGVLAAARPRLGQLFIGTAGVIQTIPALALLVFMIPFLKTGAAPAIVALFLYSLLPIINNTAAGLRAIPPSIHESAEGLGLSPLARLWLVELPLASRSILTGIRTAAVINIGTATLGALIGAGGYGQPIQTGLQLNDHREILFGAIPAAVLALLVQGLFALAERVLVPRGLRLGQ
jgi:osmoprotectant transport system permease protein